MTSYDQDSGGPDFSPAYGIQLHDPRLLEYVGAPESAQLLSPQWTTAHVLEEGHPQEPTSPETELLTGQYH